jgi:hypothetical protein
MRRAARTDANHAEVVSALRRVGCMVHDTSQLGGGFPDVIASIGRRLALIEIKDGSLPPSKRRLTPDEHAFHERWKPHAIVISSVEQAISWAQGKPVAAP